MSESRYTVSLHSGTGKDHYDLFLEEGDLLRTWRLSAPPESGCVDIDPIGDHRIAYIDYEGEVSGGRGRVTIHSRGTYALSGEVLVLHGGSSAGRYRFGAKSLEAAPKQE